VQQNGFRVPQDLSIIGFDDSPVVSHWSSPAITVIKQPDRLIAIEAVNFILENGQGDKTGFVPTNLSFFKPELVVRDSVKEFA
jgi:alanine racemase